MAVLLVYAPLSEDRSTMFGSPLLLLFFLEGPEKISFFNDSNVRLMLSNIPVAGADSLGGGATLSGFGAGGDGVVTLGVGPGATGGVFTAF